MPNPPYSGSVIIITECISGFQVLVAHWGETIDIATGMTVPPSPPGLEQMIQSSNPKPTFTQRFNFANRAALVAGFQSHVNNAPPNGFSESP